MICMHKNLLIISVIFIAISAAYIISQNKNFFTPKTFTNVRNAQGNPSFSPVTHTWYSALYFKQNEAFYANPNSYKVTPDGIEMSRPQTNFTPKTIFYTHITDFVVTFASKEKIQEKAVTRAGEWDVEAQITGVNKNTFSIHAIKGSPVFYVNNPTTNLQIDAKRFKDGKKLNDKMFRINTADDKAFVIMADTVVNFDEKDRKFTFGESTKKISILALPDEYVGNNSKDPNVIASCALQQPEFTDYSLSADGSKINASLYFSDSKDKKFLTTLWPHLNTSNIELTTKSDILGTYMTSKGILSLVCQPSIAYTIQTPELPVSYESVISTDSEKLQQASKVLDEEYEKFSKITMAEGVYFKGKYIKQLVDMWEVSRIVKNEKIEKELQGKIKTILLNETKNFSLNEQNQMVFHVKNEFGSEKGNDHHFHNAYYAYSYATFYDQFSDQEKKQVDALINKYITEGIPTLKKDSPYPRKIRFLDPFESHSWADAQALFGDGSNQESTSEALFYWYSLYLWSQKTHNSDLQKYANFGFYSELAGRDAYWFLLNNKALQEKFEAPILSLVWGGKSDYSTWFSGEEDKIFGIQLLPINPSSFVSFDLQGYEANEVKRLTDYYDKFFSTNPKTANFHQYYFVMKKLNRQRFNKPNMPEDEYFLKALDILIEPKESR